MKTVALISGNNGADQLRSCLAPLFSPIDAKCWFSHDAAQIRFSFCGKVYVDLSRKFITSQKSEADFLLLGLYMLILETSNNCNIFYVLVTSINEYEGRSESSNNCLVDHIIFIVKQKEIHLF